MPASFLIWQIYFPISAPSALAISRVAMLSINHIWTFSLSLIISPLSFSQTTEIGGDPSTTACRAVGSPTKIAVSLSFLTKRGGSDGKNKVAEEG